jgi:uncharacterized protein (DUF58 family)
MGATAPLTPDRVLRRLEWHVIRRLDGRLQGEYGTTLRGHGTDYLDLRDYEYGDDVRHIDWNVSARMDSVFVREFTEDREVTGWLLIDRSASMTFGPVERTKEEVGREVATTFAQLLVRGGNRVGAILYDNDVQRTIPPRQGRNQVLILLRELLRPAPKSGLAGGDGGAARNERAVGSGRARGNRGPGGKGAVTDLSGLLSLATRVIRRRSLVVIVSDFITEPGWEQPLRRLAARHEVVAVRLIDRREFELPDAGLIVVEDAETGEQLLIDTSDPILRRRLRAAGTEREQALQQATARAGVDLYTIATDDDLVLAFVRMAESRKRRR